MNMQRKKETLDEVIIEDISEEEFNEAVAELQKDMALEEQEIEEGSCNKMRKEEDEEEKAEEKAEDKDKKSPKGKMKESSIKQFKKIIDEQDNLNQDMKLKLATVFEASVNVAIAEEIEALEEQFEKALFKGVVKAKDRIAENVNLYLKTVTKSYFEHNQEADVARIKVEKAEAVLSGIKSLFEENYIKLDDSKADIVESLETDIKNLEEKYNTRVDQTLKLANYINENKKADYLNSLSESMTALDKAKFQKLSESIAHNSFDEFKQKVGDIKDTFNFRNSSDEAILEGNVFSESVDMEIETKDDSSEDIMNQLFR